MTLCVEGLDSTVKSTHLHRYFKFKWTPHLPVDLDFEL